MIEPVAIIERHQDFSPREAHEKLLAAARNYQMSAMHIAHYGWRVERDELWRGLGYDSMSSYIDALQIPRSSFRHYIRIGQVFDLSGVPLTVMEKIPFSNAAAMLEIPLSLRDKYDWVTDALSTRQGEFLRLMEERIKNADPDAKPISKFSIHLWPEQIKAAKIMLQQFQEKYELRTLGQTFEYIIAEHFDRPNIAAAAKYALEHIPEDMVDVRSRLQEALNTRP